MALPSPVNGDFDRDGRKDVAQFVLSRGGTYTLVIRRGAGGRPVVIADGFQLSRMSDVFIAKADPGHWETWCGKGGGSDDEPCPRKYVNLKGGELVFGIQEATESVVLWTGKRFAVVLISD